MKSLPFGVLMLLSLLISAAVSFGITPIVKRMAYKVGAVDVPKDARRMHSVPIPRLGGLAIAIAFLLTVLLFANVDEQMRGILLGAVVILVLGVLDDCLTLRAWFKFLVQIFAAYLVTSHGCTIRYFSNPIVTSSVQYLDLGKWSVPITIVWIVAITNAVNFIDGLDGLAVGVSAISAATLLVIALLVAESNIAIVVAALLGACLGFLPYNFNPAKIFMGDTGSTFLGFILASLSIQGMFKLYAIISFAVPFLMLGIPIFDICFAIIRPPGQAPEPHEGGPGAHSPPPHRYGLFPKAGGGHHIHADGYAGPGGCGAHLLGRGTGPHPHRGGVCGRRHWLPLDFQPEPPTPAGAAGGSK